MKTITLGIISLLLLGIFTAGCSGKYDKNVMLVREGTMNMKPDVPLGKALDKFFDKSEWKSFTSTQNETIVEFNGSGKWLDTYQTVRMQFSIIGNEFNFRYMEINGMAIDTEIALGILFEILNEYQP